MLVGFSCVYVCIKTHFNRSSSLLSMILIQLTCLRNLLLVAAVRRPHLLGRITCPANMKNFISTMWTLWPVYAIILMIITWHCTLLSFRYQTKELLAQKHQTLTFNQSANASTSSAKVEIEILYCDNVEKLNCLEIWTYVAQKQAKTSTFLLLWNVFVQTVAQINAGMNHYQIVLVCKIWARL